MTAIVRTYTTGSGAVETVPTNVNGVSIEAWGGCAGGDGVPVGVGPPGNGGPGGGYSLKVLTLTSADWGKTFVYTVGARGLGGAAGNGAGGSGGPSFISNGTDAQTVAMTANGGIGGNVTGGGTASGGSTNTTGNSGTVGFSGGAGAVGITGLSGYTPGNGGAGGQHSAPGTGGAGAVGTVRFTYTGGPNGRFFALF